MVLDNMSTTSSTTTRITIKIYTISYENDQTNRAKMVYFSLAQSAGVRLRAASSKIPRFFTFLYGFLWFFTVSRAVCVTCRLCHGPFNDSLVSQSVSQSLAFQPNPRQCSSSHVSVEESVGQD